MKRSVNCISCKTGEKTQWNQTDRDVARVLHAMGERIEVSDSLKERIDGQLRLGKKEERSMKRFGMKKVAIGVAAACLLVGTVCIAGSGMRSYISSSSTIPDYRDFADLPKAEAETGYEVDAVEKFSNGFTLEGIHIGEEAIKNEAGQEEDRQKDISLHYAKDGDMIFYDVRKLFHGESADTWDGQGKWDKKVQVGDVTVYYSRLTQKTVPLDYELTEEDKAGMENGSLNVGYGTPEIEINRFDYACWIKDGKLYEISGFDLSIGEDDILGMAREALEEGK